MDDRNDSKTQLMVSRYLKDPSGSVDPETGVLDSKTLAGRFANLMRARPKDEWHEDYGVVLWWRLPVCEPPWAGTPLDSEWEDNDFDEQWTHWTPIVCPFDTAMCRFCNAPATCYGTYEGMTGYACDECCGHGCEDGHCERLKEAELDS